MQTHAVFAQAAAVIKVSKFLIDESKLFAA
jgi:hypothetical protein